MKNILKLSLISAGFIAIAATASAQDIKNDAAKTAGQLEAPKATESKSDGTSTTTTTTTATPAATKTDKQDPKKTTPAASGTTSKNTSKTDTASSGGNTRMAITEQGMPKKKKSKSKTAPPAEAPKK